ncbi:MAG: hypothetical protein ACW99Q_26295, partial [Candidatus Kariarchaeaceae archaeon]
MTEAVQVKETRVESIGFAEKIKLFFSNRVMVYIIRRIIIMIPLFFGISILTFLMVRSYGSPTDAITGSGVGREVTVAILEKQYGLDQPLHIQYWLWLQSFVKWEFGYSVLFNTSSPAADINKLIWLTAKLQYSAIFLSILIAIPLGVHAARNRGSTVDSVVSGIALLGLSMPIYVSGIMLIFVFGIGISIGPWFIQFPTHGAYTTFREEFDFSKLFT